MSWVVTSPGGTVVELYEPANVEKARAAGWRIEPIEKYLARINIEIRLAELERQRNANYWRCHMQASMSGYAPLPRSFFEERAQLEARLRALREAV